MTAVALPRSTALTEAGREFGKPLTEPEARELTAEIRADVQELLPKIRTAYQRRADLALGYASWDAYCDAELSGLRMSIADRPEAVAALRSDGMSVRAIAAGLGISKSAVGRELATVPGGTVPDRITGTDGKERPASRPASKPAETPGPVEPPSADPGPDLTPDVLRVLRDAGAGGMTAWQVAFLLDSANPAELDVAVFLNRLADARQVDIVGAVDGGALWALTELLDEPAAAPAPVAGPGSASPEPERHLRAVPEPATSPAAEELRADLARESERRTAVASVRSLLTYLTSRVLSPEQVAQQYAQALADFTAADLRFAAETMAALAALKEQ